MSENAELKLYIKAWCPWCIGAMKWLDDRGFRYEKLDIERNGAAAAEMHRISGQTLTPTLVAGSKVLPDFGTDELEAFVDEHGLAP